MSDIAWLTARPIAHRGYHDASAGRVENTLPAFEAAIARDFAIECDVHETADGEIVVFHDDRLERLTSATGAVRYTTLAGLRAARFRIGAAHIATLDELLDLTGGRVPLVIELKTAADNSRRLAASVAAALDTYSGPVAVMAFEPLTMTSMRSVAPHLPRGMIVDEFSAADYPSLSAPARFGLRHLLAAPFVLPQFVACDVKRLPALVPSALRRWLHLPLLTWTVRTPPDRQKATAFADQIIFEGFDPDRTA